MPTTSILERVQLLYKDNGIITLLVIFNLSYDKFDYTVDGFLIESMDGCVTVL